MITDKRMAIIFVVCMLLTLSLAIGVEIGRGQMQKELAKKDAEIALKTQEVENMKREVFNILKAVGPHDENGNVFYKNTWTHVPDPNAVEVEQNKTEAKDAAKKR